MVLTENKKMAIIMTQKEYGFNKTIQKIGTHLLTGELSEADFEEYIINEGIINKAKILSAPMRVKLMIIKNSRYN